MPLFDGMATRSRIMQNERIFKAVTKCSALLRCVGGAPLFSSNDVRKLMLITCVQTEHPDRGRTLERTTRREELRQADCELCMGIVVVIVDV